MERPGTAGRGGARYVYLGCEGRFLRERSSTAVQWVTVLNG